MIKAVLFDLDDTLIHTHFGTFFPAYLQTLGEAGSRFGSSQVFVRRLLDTFDRTVNTYDPTTRLYERFLELFAAEIGVAPTDLSAFFEDFYHGPYAGLSHIVEPQPGASDLLRWMTDNGIRLVVATNPAMPASSIVQRMTWGELQPENYPFELITTLERMHFAKPQPEYFCEILIDLGLNASDAIMVGDDWERDIVAAAQVGLNTFWVSPDGEPPPDRQVVDGVGSFEDFCERVYTGWLNDLRPLAVTPAANIHWLAAFPAILDNLRRGYPAEILECRPAEEEWSCRDVLCHLRDHEIEEDRPRLARIVEEDNPFLSANYDPWANADRYRSVSTTGAFLDFVDQRGRTVEWMKGLEPDAWNRPARFSILGPTKFGEMARFTSEHDRTHLQQMRRAIASALAECDERVGQIPR